MKKNKNIEEIIIRFDEDKKKYLLLTRPESNATCDIIYLLSMMIYKLSERMDEDYGKLKKLKGGTK